jgi:hypothetical protein
MLISFPFCKFRKVDICEKNWPNKFRVGCKSPSNLVEFLERDVNLEDELENFEGDFEKSGIVEVWKLYK